MEKTIGEVVKAVRLKKKLTQQQVAEKANISQPYYNMIENDREHPPTIYAIEKVADVLDFDAEGRKRLIKLLEIKRIKYEQGRLDKQKQRFGIRPPKSGECRFVPVLGHISADKLIGFTGREYPANWVEDCEYCPPEINDPLAYSWNVDGDSMEPKISQGDRVIVSPNTKAKTGEVVAVDQEGKQILKRIHFRVNQVVLTSDNPKYPPIFWKIKNRPKILGKVVRIIKRP